MKSNADLTEEDSSILRYIKTLTSHQTKAKQQRMDRYMQKAKRGRPDENVKPTGLKHEKVFKSSTLKDNAQFSKRNLPKQNAKVDSNFIAPSAIKVQGGGTGARKSLQSKRPYEEIQFSHGQRKKAKREKKITAIDSFDRFRFSKTNSSSKTPQHFAASDRNKVTKSSQPPSLKRETRNTLQKSEFVRVPVQVWANRCYNMTMAHTMTSCRYGW
ncbi:hypothetical protein DVH05_023126 [Phytophthora capsici]|nr:hypothetical protein DVH05_023126 [Phytophthora capsici]